MNQTANYTSFSKVLSDLVELAQTIEDMRQRLDQAGVPYISQDARQVALDGLQCDMGACGNWIKSLMSLKQLCQESFDAEWESKYRERMGTGLGIEQSEDLMLDYLRNTLTTKVHFKIETLFSNILKAISGSSPRGFWQIGDATLELAGISTSGQEKQVLTVLANLRNSFHANGVHNNADLIVQIDGIDFSFMRGQSVECGGWRHIVTAIRNNISVLRAILFSSAVSSRSTEIRDQFATGNL
ncbi:MAG: hypothetical protein GF341_04690 [candidate division Zixibacteria bacterium]|nr:hypothetical protein [candidate division Zixibacteria bacterium]